MIIRPARHNDMNDLVQLWTEFMDFHTALDPDFKRSSDGARNWVNYITPKLAEDGFQVFVAESNELLVGYVIASIMEYPPITSVRQYGFISDIAVTGEFRRRGIARQLFQTAENWLISTGIKRIELKVDVGNETSRGFWTSVGFSRHTETLIKKY